MVNLHYLARVSANTSTFRTNVDKARASLEKITQAAGKTGSAFVRSAEKLDAFGRKAQRAGAMLSATVTPAIVAAGAYAVNAAADLGEAVSKNNVVFGEQARAVEAWAETAATSFGLSKRGALDAAGSFGAMLDAMGLAGPVASEMSTELVQLAGDLGSFHNQDPTEMLDRLRSGLSGEVEPLRRFGVNLTAAAVEAEAMRLGLVDASGAVTEAGKVQARYALILEQTTTAQGDFARTAESLPNQMRTTRAELEDTAAALGEQLLPYALEAVETVRDLVAAFGELDEGTQSTIIKLAATAAVLGPLVSVAGTAARALGGLAKAYGAVSASVATGKLGAALSTTAGSAAIAYTPFVLAATAVGKLSDALDYDPDAEAMVDALATLGETSGHTGELVRTFGSNLDELWSDLDVSSELTGVQAVFEGLATGLNAITPGDYFSTSWQQAADDVEAVGSALGELAVRDTVTAIAAFDELRTSAEASGVSYGELATRIPELANVLAETGVSLEFVVAQLDAGATPAEALAAAQEQAAAAAGEHADALDEQGDAAGDAAEDTLTLTEAIAQLVEEQRAAVDPVFAAVKATRDYAAAQESAAEARASLADGEGTEAELEDATLKLADAALELEGALLAVDPAGDAARDTFAGLGDRGLLAADDLRVLEGSLVDVGAAARDTQGEYTVDVVSDTDRALDELDTLAERIAKLTGRPYTVRVKADTYTPSRDNARTNVPSGSSSSGSSRSGPSNSFAAFGGYRSAGRATWVGERGPELFVPSSAGTVLSNRELQAAAAAPSAPAPAPAPVFSPTVNVQQQTGNPYRDASVELRKLAAHVL